MSKKLIRGSLLATTVIAGMSFATTAFAQDAAPPTEATPEAAAPPAEAAPATAAPDAAVASEEVDQADIVVTGTLIRNPNLVASAPVTVVGQEEIQLRQSNVAEEVLRSIPGVVPSIGSNVNNGNGGASYVNLRGLGSNRNIVLLDGTRIVPSDIVGRVDLNNIPLALVDRVDVLTGGASSTYGADAVGGVVNFITRSDFAGVELTGSEQITERGDGNIFRTDLTIGANFDDGRGNAVFSIGYQEADPVYFGGDRPSSEVTLESYDETFIAGQGSGTTVPSRFIIGGGIAATQVSPDGIGIQPFYKAFNFNPFNVFQVPFKRYNMYGSGHYDVTDGITVYGRGMFSKNTVDTIIAPSGIFGSTVTVPVANPFLSAPQRAFFCANADFNPALAGRQTLTPAECIAATTALTPSDPNYRQFTLGVGRRTPEVGPRISSYETQMFDFKAGVRGDITDKIGFDVFGARGESSQVQSINNYVLLSRARQALLATNTTSCLTATNGCVPLNIFGQEGTIDPAMADFISDAASVTNKSRLSQARGIINGEAGVTSPWADTPISFALGAEYRKYAANQRSDALAKQAGELGGAGGAAPDVNGGIEVTEGYAEVIAPLVTDKDFFQSLTLEAGIRRSHYTVDTASKPKFKTTTWKVAGSWQPVSDIKIRGNYNHAVRAPNIFELFFPVTVGLTNLSTDPCEGNAAQSNATLAAVCIGQGADPADIAAGTVEGPISGQVNLTFGGNINLQPEIADTWTVGAVLTPSFLPGFNATIDYYNIKVKDAITTPTPDDIMSACFGNLTPASATDPACIVAIRRNPNGSGLSGPPDTTPGLLGVFSNLGKIETSGVDLTMNYRRTLGTWFGTTTKLNLNFGGNWTDKSLFQASPLGLNRECVGYYSVNCSSIQPEWSFNQRSTLSLGRVDLSLLWRYMSSVKFEPAQLEADRDAAIAANTDALGNPLPLVDQGCPNFETDAGDAIANGGGACMVDERFRKIKAYSYFDFATRFNVNEHFDMTVTAYNIFDKKPPIVGGTVGSTTFSGGNTYPSSYDAVGRRFAVGARLKF